MAKGLYLMSDGQMLVEYGKRRRVPIPFVTNFPLKFRARRARRLPMLRREGRRAPQAYLRGDRDDSGRAPLGRQALAANGCHGRPARSCSDNWSFGRPELRGIFRSPTVS